MLALADVSSALIGAAATIAVAVAGGLVTLYAPDWKARRDRQRQFKELEARYRDSLARAAAALQGRLYNIAMLNFSGAYVQSGTEEERFHAVTSTVWLIGQYLCWVELLRRDAYSLALGGVGQGRKLLGLLERIEQLFATDEFGSRFRLWRAEQSAIGELMIVEHRADQARNYDCLGYATFVRKLEDPQSQLQRWFRPLEEAVRDNEPSERLAHLQNALVDLVDFLYGGEIVGLEKVGLREH